MSGLSAALKEAAQRTQAAEQAAALEAESNCTRRDSSCLCLKKDNSIRAYCIYLTNQPWFDTVVMTVCDASPVTLFRGPFTQPSLLDALCQHSSYVFLPAHQAQVSPTPLPDSGAELALLPPLASLSPGNNTLLASHAGFLCSDDKQNRIVAMVEDAATVAFTVELLIKIIAQAPATT